MYTSFYTRVALRNMIWTLISPWYCDCFYITHTVLFIATGTQLWYYSVEELEQYASSGHLLTAEALEDYLEKFIYLFIYFLEI